MTPEELKEVKELIQEVLAVKVAGAGPDPEEVKAKKKADIMAIKDQNERQKAIATNLDLFLA